MNACDICRIKKDTTRLPALQGINKRVCDACYCSIFKEVQKRGFKTEFEWTKEVRELVKKRAKAQ